MVKIMENPIKLDDLGGFTTPIFGNIHIKMKGQPTISTTTLKATPVVPEKNLKGGDEFQLLEPIYVMGVLVLKPVNVMFKTLQKGTLIHPAKPVDGTSRFENTIS